MKFEVIEQYVDFTGDKPLLKNDIVAIFESIGRAYDYCRDCNSKDRNILYVREK